MSTLPFKIFNGHGHYLAATRYPEEAAMLIAALGTGCEIRVGHRKVDAVWREGREKQPAAESYDFVAKIIRERTEKTHAAAMARLGGTNEHRTT